ncbi:MAG: cell division ATP-binding protein FtsE [Oscillospiraceae bacterium]|jgi:cell division transport system ATP-binding protein|nr:cell division ATP-binding protein FtsE [Oscillospiraceae bacterium]
MIEFKNICKKYSNEISAVRNISFSVDKGEFVFIVGPSGAGKSTILKLITCEETPTSGKLTVNNVDIFSLKRRQIPYFRRTMGIVFQDFRLIDKMTVFDNVAFAMHVTGASQKAIRARVPYVLDLVDLKNKAKALPTELSGGEQQRVGLARALVNNPDLLVADEPTGNIDPSLSFEIIKLLAKINSCGTTVLIVTHEHNLVKKFKKRVIAIDSGRVISDMNLEVLKNEA